MLILVAACASLVGCHSTTSLLGDTSVDTTTDTVDGTTDAVMDPGTDAGPPDVGPDGDIDVVPACPEPNPAPDGPVPYFEIDDSAWPVGAGEIFANCIVDGIAEGSDGSYTVFLTCDDTGETHTILVHAQVPIWPYVIPGEPVELWYTWNTAMWGYYRWFALNWAWGGLIMAGGEGREMPIGPGYPPLYPLEIEMVEGVCGLERDECGTFERTGIRVGLHGESRVFYDRTHGSVGSMGSAQVVMGPSFVYHDMECDDFPDRLVSGLIFMIPEG